MKLLVMQFPPISLWTGRVTGRININNGATFFSLRRTDLISQICKLTNSNKHELASPLAVGGRSAHFAPTKKYGVTSNIFGIPNPDL
jgi:hypothetical protein